MKEAHYIVVEKSCCGTCIHYCQHYVLDSKGRPNPIWYGHCCEPRIKHRTPEETCPRWQAPE